MSVATERSAARRAALRARRDLVQEVLGRYRATDPRLFGSVARGEATEHSDAGSLTALHDAVPL